MHDPRPTNRLIQATASIGIDFMYQGKRQVCVQFVEAGIAIAFVDFDGDEATRVGYLPGMVQSHVIEAAQAFLAH